MLVTELDTFVHKFHQLWNAGYNAHLDLDTRAGVAWVGLRVQLGHVPGPLHHQVPPPFSKNWRKAETRLASVVVPGGQQNDNNKQLLKKHQ